MKRILFLLTIISSTSLWSEWTYFGVDTDGVEYLIDYENIERSDDNNIYFWFKTIHKEPNVLGDKSVTNFSAVSCNVPRKFKPLLYKGISFNSESSNEFTPEDKWLYPSPNSPVRNMMNLLCD